MDVHLTYNIKEKFKMEKFFTSLGDMVLGACILGAVVITSDPLVDNATVCSSTTQGVPNVIHLDVQCQNDLVLVQNPQGEYMRLKKYLGEYVAPAYRDSVRTQIERIVEEQRE